MKKVVGFDQKVMLHQLDYMVREMPQSDQKQLYQKMDEYLARDIRGVKARQNTRTIIFKIWYNIPGAHQAVKQQALTYFPQLPSSERMLLHWGLMILAYPFVKDLIQEIGYSYRLQDEISTTQLKRKMKQLYGDRRRVEVATEAVLTSLRSWGVLETAQQGLLHMNERIQIGCPESKQWLTEVLILATGVTAITKEQILNHPLFFPFDFGISLDELNNGRFVFIHQGVNLVMVSLKREKAEPENQIQLL